MAAETLDTSGLSYDFDAHHVGFAGSGSDARAAVEEWASAVALPDLIVDAAGGVVWGWFGRAEEFGARDVDALAEAGRRMPLKRGADTRLALGEPAPGLAGWRFTHHQARAALSVAMQGGEAIVRYRDVAVLASILKDELLATSLRRLYLEPLEDGRGGGEELRRTLRAYFAADGSATAAGDAIGVTRQAVARRLRTAEQALGRSLAACGAELEIALRYEALGTTPLSAL